MAILDTPITSNDDNLSKVLGQKKPTIVIFHKGLDKPLEDTMRTLAKKNSGDLLLVKMSVEDSDFTYTKYGNLSLPALVTLEHGFTGPKVKSQAENIRPKDLRAHTDHLLTGKPIPEEKKASSNVKAPAKKTAGARQVNNATFQREVIKSKQPVLVDFWAPWCGPCQSIAPMIDKLAEEYAGKVKIVKVNTDQNRKLATDYQIQSIPTTILFDGGKPVQRIVGANVGAIQNLLRNAAN